MAAWKGKTNNVVELMKEGASADLVHQVCLFLHLILCMRPYYLVNIDRIAVITQNTDIALI